MHPFRQAEQLTLPPTQIKEPSNTLNPNTMASTPSKDYKRLEREQKKREKKMAREEARAEKLRAAQEAEQKAAEEARIAAEKAELEELERATRPDSD